MIKKKKILGLIIIACVLLFITVRAVSFKWFPLSNVSNFLRPALKCGEYTSKMQSIIMWSDGDAGSCLEFLSRWPSWTAQEEEWVYKWLPSMGSGYDNLNALKPCKKLASVHKKWLKALKLYKESEPLARKGIETSDANLISEAIDLIKKGREFADEAAKEFEPIFWEGLMN